jgi:hypothetical protein
VLALQDLDFSNNEATQRLQATGSPGALYGDRFQIKKQAATTSKANMSGQKVLGKV